MSTCLLCGYVVRGGCHYYSIRRGPALSKLKAAGGSQSISLRLF